MRSLKFNFLISTKKAHVLNSVLIFILCGCAHMAGADPVCDSVVSIPADGSIPAGSTISNSSLNACFPTSVAITNNGTVQNNPGASLTNSGNLTNNSVINNNGSLTNYVGAAFIDAGYFNNNTGAVFTNGGSWSAANVSNSNNDGAIVNNAGATINFDKGSFWTGRNNSAASFTNSGTLQMGSTASIGNWGVITNNAGAKINGGRLYNLSGTVVNHGSIDVDGVANSKNFINDVGAVVHTAGLDNYGTLTNKGFIYNSAHNFDNSGFYVADDAISLINESGATIVSDGAFINTHTITNNGSIINNGDMFLEAWSAVNGSGTISQTGANSRLRANGLITQSAVSIFGGRLQGKGTLTASVAVSGGELSAGDLGVGKFTINGDLNLQNGTLVTEIRGTGDGQFDVLNVAGQTNLAGSTLKFIFLTNDIYQVGTSWLFFTGNTSGLSLNQVNFVFDNSLGATFSQSIVNGGIKLTVLTSGTAVPVPSAAWLFGSGLLGCAAVGRRKIQNQIA